MKQSLFRLHFDAALSGPLAPLAISGVWGYAPGHMLSPPPGACRRTMSRHILANVVIAIKRGEKAAGLSKERLAMTALNLFSVRLCRRRVMRTQPSGTTLSELSGKSHAVPGGAATKGRQAVLTTKAPTGAF